MPFDLETLGINQLGVRDKLELIEQIWDSLPANVTADEVPQWHLLELAKRRVEATTSPEAGRPWREVLTRLENRL